MEVVIDSNRSVSWDNEGNNVLVFPEGFSKSARYYEANEVVAILCAEDNKRNIYLYSSSGRLLNTVSESEGIYFLGLTRHVKQEMAVVCSVPSDKMWQQWHYGFNKITGQIIKLSPHK